MDFDYNTKRPPLILKEYGRNVQKIANYINSLEDRQKRNQLAELLTELMRQIHPNMREGQDYANKLWDDLYILSSFSLDVDSPFPLPEKTLLGKKPAQVPYNNHELYFKYYGKNVELLIEKAIALENTEERESAIIHIGRLMKTFYSTWSRDSQNYAVTQNGDDNVIVQHIKLISKGKLEISFEKVRNEGLFDGGIIREREKPVMVEEKKMKNNHLNLRNSKQQRNNNGGNGNNNNRNNKNGKNRRRQG
ncbi:MAG: DUF4290 domain-containing protein [Verrucomicrobia bacterium]|nr:DUF4290 domain-containing protein [Cytophagales bacterium]